VPISAPRKPRGAERVELAAVVPGFEAESELEESLAQEPALLAGLTWGEPRAGHPEGPVGVHVGDLLRAIDAHGFSGEPRARLRFMALVHDAFKHRVHEWWPKAGRNHHATRARRFAERFTDEQSVLAAIEHHDRPYNLWRKMKRRGELDDPAFLAMMESLGDVPLFLHFVELDGGTEGKNPEPVRWFREELDRRGIPH
jgi:hypothetical protein